MQAGGGILASRGLGDAGGSGIILLPVGSLKLGRGGRVAAWSLGSPASIRRPPPKKKNEATRSPPGRGWKCCPSGPEGLGWWIWGVGTLGLAQSPSGVASIGGKLRHGGLIIAVPQFPSYESNPFSYGGTTGAKTQAGGRHHEGWGGRGGVISTPAPRWGSAGGCWVPPERPRRCADKEKSSPKELSVTGTGFPAHTWGWQAPSCQILGPDT